MRFWCICSSLVAFIGVDDAEEVARVTAHLDCVSCLYLVMDEIETANLFRWLVLLPPPFKFGITEQPYERSYMMSVGLLRPELRTQTYLQ